MRSIHACMHQEKRIAYAPHHQEHDGIPHEEHAGEEPGMRNQVGGT